MADLFKQGELARSKFDYADAVIKFKMAADSGYLPAIMALGHAHEKGEGVPKNLNQALALYKLAQEKKHPDADDAVDRVQKELTNPLAAAPVEGMPDRWKQAPKTATLGRRAGKAVFAATQTFGP